VKGELLLMILTLLPNKFDRIQLFKPALRDAYERSNTPWATPPTKLNGGQRSSKAR
jgi:hypothetical protein